MLDALRKLLDPAAAAPQAPDARAIEMAAAALLVEVMGADGDVSAMERESVAGAVRAKFGLDAVAAAELVAEAETAAARATDAYEFTSLVNRRCTQAQKERIVELLWEVAYADASLNQYEEHLIRRIADLLHVSHRVYIRAKLRARGRGGGGAVDGSAQT